MKYAHNIQIRVFSKQGEDSTKILEGLLRLIQFKIEDEKLILKKSTAIGFENKKITIYEIVLVKERHTKKILEELVSKIDSEQKNLLINQIYSRLDNKLNFYIRIDKDILLNEDRLFITDSGNCFHIKISIATFPATIEKASDVVKRIFR